MSKNPVVSFYVSNQVQTMYENSIHLSTNWVWALQAPALAFSNISDFFLMKCLPDNL